MVSHRTKPKNDQSIGGQNSLGGGERYVFLEDDDLDTEEELPINAISQLKKETQTNNLRAT